MSPQTKDRFDNLDLPGYPEELRVYFAFREIGRAIGSKRTPISDKDLKRLMLESERLLKAGDEEISNAVATDMLEEIWSSAQNSGFDFSRVDPHLGTEARRYLLQWDDFNKTKTPGLSRTR